MSNVIKYKNCPICKGQKGEERILCNVCFQKFCFNEFEEATDEKVRVFLLEGRGSHIGSAFDVEKFNRFKDRIKNGYYTTEEIEEMKNVEMS